MLRQCAVGFGSLALAALLAEESRPPRAGRSAGRRSRRTFPPRAKRVIFLFMNGGPSHVDTFDHKPLLAARPRQAAARSPSRACSSPQTGNLLGSPWKFQQHGQSGIWVSELFPHVAECVDDLCFIHSLHGTNPAHGGALLKLHTGSDTFVRPSMGSWVTYGLGTENQNLPGFVTICPTLAHGGVNNWSSAFLPAVYQGTPLGNASIPADQARVRYISNARLPPRAAAAAARPAGRDEPRAPGRSRAGRRRSKAASTRSSWPSACRRRCPRSRTSPASRRRRSRLYGLDDPVTANFGRQCLLARRFAERGVRFVQVTHSDATCSGTSTATCKKGHAKNAREVDQADRRPAART